ncbi:hypothetical protein CUJ83_06570 [Methanocella sp. CWC-04]|uniref:Uncharacterized protein n=1 Tax=Methanooceanicella nereidis TaxID=2052831 RepID=A0AAP2REF2_9EURY|nr:hypothetical protein [Methanocella sp. CWC-04]
MTFTSSLCCLVMIIGEGIAVGIGVGVGAIVGAGASVGAGSTPPNGKISLEHIQPPIDIVAASRMSGIMMPDNFLI